MLSFESVTWSVMRGARRFQNIAMCSPSILTKIDAQPLCSGTTHAWRFVAAWRHIRGKTRWPFVAISGVRRSGDQIPGAPRQIHSSFDTMRNLVGAPRRRSAFSQAEPHSTTGSGSRTPIWIGYNRAFIKEGRGAPCVVAGVVVTTANGVAARRECEGACCSRHNSRSWRPTR